MSESPAFFADPPALPVAQIEAAPPTRPALVSARRFLFVTAPFGPFSKRLAKALRAAGAHCDRVILNGGDLSEWGTSNAAFYFGGPLDWPGWIEERLGGLGVTDLITHGDTHSYAAEAIRAAGRLGLRVHVFEQGYFRPHWVTLERDGVNANSRLPRTPDHYRQIAPAAHRAPPTPVGRITPAAVVRIAAYHLWTYAAAPLFPRYRAPYPYPAVRQAQGHAGRYLSQKLLRRRHAGVLAQAVRGDAPVYLALLQRPGDSQLTRHSRFKSLEEFAQEVAGSFARHAPADARLVFKVHPLDHGLQRHGAAVARVAARLKLENRLFCVEGGHLPTLLARAAGVVSVNSTGGISALEAGKPTLVLGEAIYDMPGLTHQGGLDRFWQEGERPDPELYEAYSAAVKASSQINGAFSTRHGIDLIVPEAVRRLLSAHQ